MYGDTATARKRVAQLREQGADIRAMADRLVAQAEGVPWTGRAAESMRARIKERASHLRLAASHHDAAADSLARHATEVDALKDAIETASHKAGALVADARTRASGATTTGAPSHEDAALLAFTPPPAGHKDWLTTELPGL
jgi:Tfp pilus assembly protein FimV